MNNNFIIASRAYFLQLHPHLDSLRHYLKHHGHSVQHYPHYLKPHGRSVHLKNHGNERENLYLRQSDHHRHHHYPHDQNLNLRQFACRYLLLHTSGMQDVLAVFPTVFPAAEDKPFSWLSNTRDIHELSSSSKDMNSLTRPPRRPTMPDEKRPTIAEALASF